MSVAIVGAGKMGQAMARGFLRSGVLSAKHVIGSSPDPDCLSEMGSLGVKTTLDNSEAVTSSDIVLLAVKPHIMPQVLDEIAPCIKKDHLVISVAAGVKIDYVEKKLPEQSRVVRLMPNTPCVVGEGAFFFARGASATQSDAQTVLKYFSTIGYCSEGDESFIDAVTGVSGCGPAYGFCAIDAVADGGVMMGLPRHLALKLAAQTLLGAAKMVLDTGKHPMVLKDEVCSPGGATISAIHTLEENGFRKCLMNAVKEASLRAGELSQQK